MRTRAQRFSFAALLVLIYLYCFPYFEEMHSANELPRVYLTMAVLDEGEFHIDTGVGRWGMTADMSPHAGHVYSNKAPGSSFLALPAYAGLKLAKGLTGAAPSLAELTWTFRIFTGVLPSLLFLILLWRFLGRFAPAPRTRRLLLAGYALGSMAMAYSVIFVSHQLAAICIASAYIISTWVLEEGLHKGWLWVVGLLAGCAPLVDYQAAFAGVPLAIFILYHLLWKDRTHWKAVFYAVGGAVAPIALLLYYHARSFGSPWKTGYSASQSFAHFHQKGFLGMDKLRYEAFEGSLYSMDNGLLVFCPMLLLAIPGWYLMARRKQWGHFSLTLSVAIIYIAFISSINFWRGGWQVGPRYIVAMIPFLMVPIAVAFSWAESRWVARSICLGLSGVGIFVYTLSCAVFPHFPESFGNPFYQLVLPLLWDGAVPYNGGWLIGLHGTLSLVPHFIVLAFTWVWIARPDIKSQKSALLGSAICVGILAGYWLLGAGLTPGAESAYARILTWMP